MCSRQQTRISLLVVLSGNLGAEADASLCVLVENLGAAAVVSLCVGCSCRYQTRNRVPLVLEDTLKAAQAGSMCSRTRIRIPVLVVLVGNLGAGAVVSLCVGWSCRYQTRNRLLLVLEDTLYAAQVGSVCSRKQTRIPVLVVLVENLGVVAAVSLCVLVENLGAAAVASLCVGCSCRYQTRNRVPLVLEDTLEAAQAGSVCSRQQTRIPLLVVLVENLGEAAAGKSLQMTALLHGRYSRCVLSILGVIRTRVSRKLCTTLGHRCPTPSTKAKHLRLPALPTGVVHSPKPYSFCVYSN